MQLDKIVKVSLRRSTLLSILEGIKKVRIGVVGDACLDIYWDADMRLSELSRETPHYPLPVVRERIYLGGGSNVAANARELRADRVYMLSLIGKDWRGECLTETLEQRGIDTQYVIADDNWITPAYCKPLRSGHSDVVYEDPRIDFENRTPISKQQEASILVKLADLADKVDVIMVCDQFQYGIVSEGVRAALEALADKGMKIIVDSRSQIGLFRNVIIKPNEIEAIAAINSEQVLGQSKKENMTNAAVRLYKCNKAPVIITMGNKGALLYNGEKLYVAESIPVKPPIDVVGAGDTFSAAFSCAYAAGFTGQESIAFANLVASVVIQKIGMTGTAAPKEILQQADSILFTEGEM
jgi:rfaE bifunctional protein kinase chain/domain